MAKDTVFRDKPSHGFPAKGEMLLERVDLKSGPLGPDKPLSFRPASVNVFVGPNHSGKSLLLREIQAAFLQPEYAHQRQVLKEVGFAELDAKRRNDLLEELRNVALPNPGDPQHVTLAKEQWSQNFGRAHFEQLLTHAAEMRDVGAHQFFRRYFLTGTLLMLGGAERLNMLNPTQRERPQVKYYVHILSRLFYSDDKRKDVQAVLKEAFGLHFVIDPLSENFEPKMSSTAPSLNLERSLTDEAVDYFAAATHLSQMSDGVRAFAGTVAAVAASDAKVILIDEPEAFLHPSLCVKLAKELCKRARKNSQQLFIATHSAPFLMGCVQAGIDLNIIRLTYRDGNSTSRVLLPDQIVPLMRQPLLRSIGALTGIFYESVVVTEADADRAFYDEVNHRCLSASDSRAITDALFLNAQNWQTTARIIGPLRALGIAAAAIVDLDLLLDEKSEGFQALMENAGMPPGSRTGLGQLRGTLHKLVKPIGKRLKSDGVSCLTGSDKKDLENFIDQLAKVGIFVVPVGELECWLSKLKREAWGGKTEWLLRTFEAMGENANDANYTQPSAGDVWDFIGRVREWLHNPKRAGMPD